MIKKKKNLNLEFHLLELDLKWLSPRDYNGALELEGMII